jgi:hypothetical protein
VRRAQEDLRERPDLRAFPGIQGPQGETGPKGEQALRGRLDRKGLLGLKAARARWATGLLEQTAPLGFPAIPWDEALPRSPHHDVTGGHHSKALAPKLSALTNP